MVKIIHEILSRTIYFFKQEVKVEKIIITGHHSLFYHVVSNVRTTGKS